MIEGMIEGTVMRLCPSQAIVLAGCCDLVYVIEILLRYRYFSVISVGVLIDDREGIRAKYVGLTMTMDIISCPVVDWVLVFVGLNLPWSVLRLLRIGRVRHVDEYLANIRAMIAKLGVDLNTAVLNIISKLFGLFFVLHIFACLWYKISVMEEDELSWVQSSLLVPVVPSPHLTRHCPKPFKHACAHAHQTPAHHV